MGTRRPPSTVTLIDRVLEASVVGSFSRFGSAARRRLYHWIPLARSDAARAPGRAVITGGSSGIGRAAAELLLESGWSVAIVSRDRTRNAQAVEGLRAHVGGPGAREADRVIGLVADLSDLDSVRGLGAQLGELGPIGVLVICAGALLREFHRTDQGFEASFALEVLGPTLLTSLVAGQLAAGSRPDRASMIITVSSGGMYPVRLDIGRLNDARPANYRPILAYALAKRAQVELTREWADRLTGTGTIAVSMHPGWVTTPGIDAGLPGFARVMRPLLRTPADGADTIAWLVDVAPDVLPGGFYFDRAVRSPHVVPSTATTAAERAMAFDLVAALAVASVPPRLGWG